MNEYDRAKTGNIEYQDFLDICTEKISTRDPVEEIRKAFKLFDDEGKGNIDLKNLKRIAKELGENLTDEELQAMIDEFDTNNDGMSIFSLLCYS